MNRLCTVSFCVYLVYLCLVFVVQSMVYAEGTILAIISQKTSLCSPSGNCGT